MNLLNWLQDWYSQQCNGDWEHRYGITIETLDNPGWSVKIDLTETNLTKQEFEELSMDRSEDDWIRCRVRDGRFEGYGGVHNLEEILMIFRDWVNSKSS